MTSAKKNFAYQIIYEVLAIILPLITSPYISRVLGSSGIGVYSYTYTIANYFVLFAAHGIKNYGNREIAKNRDGKNALNETFSSIFYLHAIISGLSIVAYIIYLIFICPYEYKMYSTIQSMYILGALIDITWLFNGLEKFKITVTRNAVIKVITTLSVFIFVKNADDVWKYITILAIGSFLSQIYLWLNIKKLVKFTKCTFHMIMQHLPQMALLFIPSIAVSLYNYMDKIMVGAIAGDSQLGFYDNCEKITTTAFSVIGALGTVMLPRMSNMAAKGNEKEQQRLIDSSMQVVLSIAMALMFGILGVSEIFPTVFWGEEFSSCNMILAFLAFIIPIKAFANVLRTQYLIPRSKDKTYTVSLCSGAVVNLIVNYICIPSMGAMGAVIGTIVSEVTVCLIQSCMCRRELPLFTYIREGFPFLGFGVIMALVVFLVGRLFGTSVTTLVLQVALGAFIYCLQSLIYVKKTNNRIFLNSIDEVLSKVRRRPRR